MIKTGSIYLIVKDFEKSLEFYKLLLEKDVSGQNMNRFAIFDIDKLRLCIMNGCFDKENPDKVVTKGKYYQEYDNMDEILEKENPGKIVINLGTDDLHKEYDRLKKLDIGYHMTDIRYINARTPYYYFSLKDPDDNTIEITGPYKE